MALMYDIYVVLCEIATVNNDLGDLVYEAMKGATAMGGSAFAGAMAGAVIGGPVGMIAGGAIGFFGGTVYAAATVKKFKPLHQILGEMSIEDKEKLVAVAGSIIQRKGINVVNQIMINYGSQLARDFLIEVYKEFKG